MNTIDHMTAAVRRAKIYGESELTNYFHRNMDADACLKFDGFLVQTKDPLAYQAGTCESRFVARTRAMLHAWRAWQQAQEENQS